MGLGQCVRASKLWVKEQVAKLRHRKAKEAKQLEPQQQQQTPSLADKPQQKTPHRHSELFKRANKTNEKARSRSNPETSGDSHAQDQRKSCVTCQHKFDGAKSKYLDFCSNECKQTALDSKLGDANNDAPPPSRLSEWI